jgi:hypothetical protein
MHKFLELLELLFMNAYSVWNLINTVAIYKEIRWKNNQSSYEDNMNIIKPTEQSSYGGKTSTVHNKLILSMISPSLFYKFLYNIPHNTIHILPHSQPRQHSQLLPPSIE